MRAADLDPQAGARGMELAKVEVKGILKHHKGSGGGVARVSGAGLGSMGSWLRL